VIRRGGEGGVQAGFIVHIKNFLFVVSFYQPLKKMSSGNFSGG
jgi:hypothetical protein